MSQYSLVIGGEKIKTLSYLLTFMVVQQETWELYYLP